jgi:hypothetical protein
MCCIDRLIDFSPTAMPDLVISLDVAFYPGFDISIADNEVLVSFFIVNFNSTITTGKIVKELRHGVAYNRYRNELYVWFTDDELLKMKGHKVSVEVEVFDIFTNGVVFSSIETMDPDPIFRRRCTYSTSFNHIVPDEVESIIMKYWSEGDRCNQNDHDDAVDALRYALKYENWLGTNREKEKPMKTKKDIDRIVITKNDLNEVLLRAYSGNEIVKKTVAKCSPDDIFDFNIGAKLSVDRLYDGYDMIPKSKRKPYNGKIFVRVDIRKFSFLDPDFFTREGKIWEVKGGKIIDFDRATDVIYEDMTDEELTKLLCSTNNGSFRGFFYTIVDGYFVR